jgi:hypothetical protein
VRRATVAWPLAVLVAAAAVGAWALSAGGRESVAFLVLATVTLGWIVWLVFRAAQSIARPESPVDVAQVTGRRRKELEREKQALLKALKELDFDHEMGKVSDRDFADIGQQYRARAIRVMRQLDEGGQQYETLIAKELAARLKKPVAPLEPKSSETQKTDAPAEVKNAASDGRLSCTSCGTSNDHDAEFCKKCGTRLSATETAS